MGHLAARRNFNELSSRLPTLESFSDSGISIEIVEVDYRIDRDESNFVAITEIDFDKLSVLRIAPVEAKVMRRSGCSTMARAVVVAATGNTALGLAIPSDPPRSVLRGSGQG